MSVEENKALVRRYFDTIWNKGQFEREPEFVALDIVVHAPPIPGIPDGIAGPLTIVGTFRAAMPDIHLTQDVLFGDGDKVVQIRPRAAFTQAATCLAFPPPAKKWCSRASISSGSQTGALPNAGAPWT